MDLTSGYHQPPISEECISYTAFMTGLGIYKFERLLMGLEGTSSYFQKAISTELFTGLIEFNVLHHDLKRLETKFQRGERINISLHSVK